MIELPYRTARKPTGDDRHTKGVTDNRHMRAALTETEEAEHLTQVFGAGVVVRKDGDLHLGRKDRSVRHLECNILTIIEDRYFQTRLH